MELVRYKIVSNDLKKTWKTTNKNLLFNINVDFGTFEQ